jgi:hypothetical protein
MGISEEDMRGIGLFEDENDDPSWCSQAYTCWVRSGARRYLCQTLDKCRPKAKVQVAPPADERYIKGGATRHKCGHVCLLWQQKKCCWCVDRRKVLQPGGIYMGAAVGASKRHRSDGGIETGLLSGGGAEKREEAPRGGSGGVESEQEQEQEGLPRLYPGYRDGAGWAEGQVARDARYCRVCRHLGQGGRNLAAIVAEEDAKDAELLRLQRDADQAAADQAEEERKLAEAQALIKAMEEMANVEPAGGEGAADEEAAESSVVQLGEDHHGRPEVAAEEEGDEKEEEEE